MMAIVEQAYIAYVKLPESKQKNQMVKLFLIKQLLL
jgi:hypothetical protein